MCTLVDTISGSLLPQWLEKNFSLLGFSRCEKIQEAILTINKHNVVSMWNAAILVLVPSVLFLYVKRPCCFFVVQINIIIIKSESCVCLFNFTYVYQIVFHMLQCEIYTNTIWNLYYIHARAHMHMNIIDIWKHINNLYNFL